MNADTLASTGGTLHVPAPSMKLQVTHRTRYEYASPVRESFNEVRLKPVTSAHQTCDSFLLKVLPAARLSHYTDFHANWISFFEIPDPHTSVLIESLSRVVTKSIAIAADATPAPLAKVAECQRLERCREDRRCGGANGRVLPAKQFLRLGRPWQQFGVEHQPVGG